MVEREVVVITGAASGIGQGLARIADQRGAKLVLADINAQGLRDTAASLNSAPLIIETDVRDPTSVAALADTVFAEHAKVDLLFNNAGILRAGLSWEIEPERWRETLDVNVMGIVHCLHHFVPRMIAADRPCRIINTSSAGGFVSSPFISPYTASKFAVVALTEALAVELQLQQTKVSVSLLAPGAVRSGIYSDPRTDAFDTAVQQSVAAMSAFTDGTGLDADEFGRWVFEGIDAGRFWLIGQPEFFLPLIGARTERILADCKPEPAHYGMALTNTLAQGSGGT